MNELKQVERISTMALKEVEFSVKMAKGTLKTLTEILESIARKKGINTGENELFGYMKKGNEPCILEIPIDEIEKMKEKLERDHISYLVYQLDEKGIFFSKAEDSERVQKIGLQTQLESHHFTFIPLETMIEAYEGEELRGFSNLDYYMVSKFEEIVEHMSNETEKFLTYAVQLDSTEGDGSYSILFHPEAFQEAKAVYTKTAIELGGPTGELYRSRIEKEKELLDPNISEEKKKKLKGKRRLEIIAEKQLIKKTEKLIELYERKLSLDNGEQNEVWSSFTNGEVSFDEFFELEMVNDQHDAEEQELARRYAQSIYQTFHQGIEVIFDIPLQEERENEEVYEEEGEVL